MAWLDLGVFLRQSHRWDEALNCFERAADVCNTRQQRRDALLLADCIKTLEAKDKKPESLHWGFIARIRDGQTPSIEEVEAFLQASDGDFSVLEAVDLALYRFIAVLCLLGHGRPCPWDLPSQHLLPFARNPDACFLTELLLARDWDALVKKISISPMLFIPMSFVSSLVLAAHRAAFQ